MKFNVTGTIRGQPVTLTYSKGLIGGPTLTGDALAVEEVEFMVQALQGTSLGPVGGPYFTKNYLKEPLAAVFLIREVFDEDAEFTGDVPEPPRAPKGAII